MNSSRPRECPLLQVTVVSTTKTSLRVQIDGEVDLTNHLDLHAALTAVELDGTDTIYLDLGGLDFCDRTGADLILAFERKVRDTGRRARVRGARPSTKKLLMILANGDAPEFE
jgi:anti-anti-sigma factor